jgi:hypothetical protein
MVLEPGRHRRLTNHRRLAGGRHADSAKSDPRSTYEQPGHGQATLDL